MWLEDSRYLEEWWEMRLEQQSASRSALQAWQGVWVLFQVWCHELGSSKAEPEMRLWFRHLFGKWFRKVGMRHRKIWEGRTNICSCQNDTGPNRGSMLPDLSEVSGEPPRNLLLKKLPFPAGRQLLPTSFTLHFCTGWTGSGSIQEGPKAESTRRQTHSWGGQLWSRFSAQKRTTEIRCRHGGSLSTMQNLRKSLSRKGSSDMQVRWHLPSYAHKRNKENLTSIKHLLHVPVPGVYIHYL